MPDKTLDEIANITNVHVNRMRGVRVGIVDTDMWAWLCLRFQVATQA
jgi:hypothetical protein